MAYSSQASDVAGTHTVDLWLLVELRDSSDQVLASYFPGTLRPIDVRFINGWLDLAPGTYTLNSAFVARSQFFHPIGGGRGGNEPIDLSIIEPFPMYEALPNVP